jgi:hypothetical protein
MLQRAAGAGDAITIQAPTHTAGRVDADAVVGYHVSQTPYRYAHTYMHGYAICIHACVAMKKGATTWGVLCGSLAELGIGLGWA